MPREHGTNKKQWRREDARASIETGELPDLLLVEPTRNYGG